MIKTKDGASNIFLKVGNYCAKFASFLTLLIFFILFFILVVVLRTDPWLENYLFSTNPCCNYNSTKCNFTLVESIPDNLTYPSGSVTHLSTFDAWETLLGLAEDEIDMGEFYFSLNNEDVTPIKMKSAWQGEKIFKDIVTAGKEHGIKIRIAQNLSPNSSQLADSEYFKKEANAEVQTLDFNRLMGGGVLHTKMWIVDNKHVYLGSANMDWQSLTEVKELGVLIQDCPCLANDMKKIFEVYMSLGGPHSLIPAEWPKKYQTTFNSEKPMNVFINDDSADVFVSSSPPPFNPAGRSNDADTIVSIIQDADHFVDIAVMDYFPRMLYTSSGQQSFWPVIDDELRRAALNKKVHVRLMASHWTHTRADMLRWLQSLQILSSSQFPHVDIQAKLFVVPAYTDDQKKLKFARVNHNKYMVTDKTAYIGTSNWSGDYFVNTGGVSIAISKEKSDLSIRKQLKAIFDRDWNSEHAKNLSDFINA